MPNYTLCSPDKSLCLQIALENGGYPMTLEARAYDGGFCLKLEKVK